jgi:hypothetical protein
MARSQNDNASPAESRHSRREWLKKVAPLGASAIGAVFLGKASGSAQDPCTCQTNIRRVCQRQACANGLSRATGNVIKYYTAAFEGWLGSCGETCYNTSTVYRDYSLCRPTSCVG